MKIINKPIHPLPNSCESSGSGLLGYEVKKINDLDELIYLLEATANVHYSPDDKMWFILLKTRDKLEKEKTKLYFLVEQKDKELKKQVIDNAK